MTVKRKTPIRHTVRAHTRQGKKIKSFERGRGTRAPKRPKRMVGLNIEKLPTFQGLKRRGYFSVPEEEIDPGIRELCKRIDKLPFVAVVGSCEGHTREEHLKRWACPSLPWLSPAESIETYPENFPAYVEMFVLADQRFKLWKWLKENIHMEKVDIWQSPVEGGEEYSNVAFDHVAPKYVRDRLFHVQVKSKSLRMPFKSKRRI